MQERTEKEVRAAVGAIPAAVANDEEYEPRGRHAWFGYVVAEIVAPLVLRQMSETWKDRPPYPDWQGYAPDLRKCADEQMLTPQLPPGMTLAQWYCENEPY